MSHSAATDVMVVNKDMCYYCFDALINHLKRTNSIYKPNFTNDKYPLFVTWKIGPEEELKGCIGTFEPISLHSGLKEYSITAGTRDSRFDPINLSDLPQLKVSVSLLTNFELGKDYLDWIIGKHGIRIEIPSPRGTRTATFLPEVMPEQGWDHLQTIKQLVRKSGDHREISQDLLNSIKLTRYQSQKLSVGYEEYLAHTRN